MKIPGIILISLFLSSIVVAQSTDDWEVALYESGADSLLIVGEAGVVEEIALPADLPRPRVARVVETPDEAQLSVQLRLSPERDQIAVLESNVVYIAGLQTGDCCVTIDLTSQLSISQTPGLVDFSPDGSQLAIYFVDSGGDFLDPANIGMLIFDNAGDLVQEIAGERLGEEHVCRVENHPYGWRSDGIYYMIPFCSHKGYVTHRWDPNSDVVDHDVIRYDPSFRDDLITTGEIIHIAYDENFPLVDSGPVVSNVIVHETAEDERIIFATGTKTVLPQIYFVSGGDRVAMEFDDDEGLLLDRQGATQPIVVGSLNGFVEMTALGWLSWQDGRVLRHYSPEVIEGEALVEFEQPGAIVDWVFPEYTPSDPDRFPMVEPIVCEGPLPMRLQAGRTGVVLPDVELDVYSEAQGGGEVIAYLESGRRFYVIDGPVCGEDTWWKIQFSNEGEVAFGWIPEGSGDVYFTEQ